MASAWIQHVQKTYQAGKAKGMSYKQAMQAANTAMNVAMSLPSMAALNAQVYEGL